MQTHIITIPSATSTKVVKRWAKVVESVDMTKTDGYAFSGKFSGPEEAVEALPGSVILVVDTRKHVWNKQRREWVYRSFAVLYQVTEDGELAEMDSADGKTWALKLRDKVAELLGEQQDQERRMLSGITDNALTAELIRRGYKVIRETSA